MRGATRPTVLENQRMSVQPRTYENDSDAQTEDIVLERPNYQYGYLGRDAEGYYHHVDEATNTIYVTDEPYERTLPDGAAIYVITVRGEVDHVVNLDEFEDLDLRDWIGHVEYKRGWDERPKDVVAIVQDALGGVSR